MTNRDKRRNLGGLCCLGNPGENMRPTDRPTTGRTVLHRDGTITTWNIFREQWERGTPSDRVLASMDVEERCRVLRHLKPFSSTLYSVCTPIALLWYGMAHSGQCALENARSEFGGLPDDAEALSVDRQDGEWIEVRSGEWVSTADPTLWRFDQDAEGEEA